jgi:hypothetical protein
MRHAYIKLENTGTISIRWWVDGENGVSTRELLSIGPGESAFDIPFEEWLSLAGTFVDIDKAKDRRVPRANLN